MTSAWIASRARTIPFHLPGDCALRGVSVRPFPRAWPDKAADDALDYSVDYTAWLADCNDTISKIAVDDVSVAPATGLSIEWAVFVNGIVTLGLSGGVATLRYKVRIALTTAQGRTIAGIFTLPISNIAPAVAPGDLTAPALTFPAGTITINGTPNT
ncbi:hypothetical protein [Komagataeibacter xylinus]|uniref:Uncharacterized protein n=1 Tax=Komagataeibacter xylinus TaxID=28448 RepID=A0A857FQJ7_KOMXY|nr:hypothetical protein [Komagataeibacter xylinus]QHC36472.1 hypothetical protein FMA36_14045 [Komagataeibacter xylinus]